MLAAPARPTGRRPLRSGSEQPMPRVPYPIRHRLCELPTQSPGAGHPTAHDCGEHGGARARATWAPRERNRRPALGRLWRAVLCTRRRGVVCSERRIIAESGILAHLPQGHRRGCRQSPVRSLPYCRLRLRGGALVVCHGMLLQHRLIKLRRTDPPMARLLI